MRDLTQEYLKEILNYDSDTGIFSWRISRSNRVKVGMEAGCINKTHNYKYIHIDYRNYRAARLAWLYVHGKLPDQFVDHINHNTLDDRISNLRCASPLHNQANRRLNKNSTSGFKGVSLFRKTGKWRAMIGCTHIGYYSTPEEAYAAYLLEAKKIYGEFAHGN